MGECGERPKLAKPLLWADCLNPNHGRFSIDSMNLPCMRNCFSTHPLLNNVIWYMMVQHRKIVCTACRRRKSKCDGATPRCSTCITTHSQCRYEKAPSIAYVRALEDRISQLESRESEGESISPSLTPIVFNSQYADSISMNARGDVTYHNSTSAIHEAPPQKPPSEAVPGSKLATIDQRNAETRRTLVANAATQKSLESLSLEMIVPHTDITKDLAGVLLQLHWCWLHPMFLFVYRPAFMRDMPLFADGHRSATYCSITLLKVIYAHSCRFIRTSNTVWDPSQQGETFQQLTDRLMTEAKVSLAMETLNPPSIPTIQALLQQSAREVSYGRSSQAWLYSGMAFRMAIDLGVHVSPDKLRHYASALSPEDIEIRKRIFWSLYAWDKHISLYLGRMPNFLVGTENVSLDFLDDFTEMDPWEPFYGLDPTAAQLPLYPPTPGHIISCFVALCKLCKILCRLMMELYSPQPTVKNVMADSKMSAFVGVNEDLHGWWSELQPFLRISPDKIPSISPPPHITSLNLMYHATVILLHRPHVAGRQSPQSPAVQRSWKMCRAATTTIYDLLKMYVGTFGFHHITYMNSYCTYTAATTAVYQLETSHNQHKSALPNHKAWIELKFLLDILQRSATTMPALNRSIDIVRARVKRILDRQAHSQLSSLFTIRTDPEPQPPHSSDITSFVSSGQDEQLLENAVPQPLGEEDDLPCSTETDLIGLSRGTSTWEVWLPAFPGQDVFHGSDSMFDFQEGMSPETRYMLMGSNLDPHMQLDPQTSDVFHDS